jgi:SHS2 domain-containing protein
MRVSCKSVHMTQLDATTRSRCDQAPRGFEFLDHPGDVKLRAWSGDLESLFTAAAEGMMAFLFGSGIANLEPDRTETIEIEANGREALLVDWLSELLYNLEPDRTETIEIEANGREALLVDWLSELLYRATCEYRAYIGFRIHELTESKLKATVAGAAAEAVEDIKAVTHHELSVGECERRWQATIVFDI